MHSLVHPGAHATRRMVARQFLWLRMAKVVIAWVKACLNCQRSKVTRHLMTPVEEMDIPVHRFNHLHVDLVLQFSSGASYLMTIVDWCTCWPEAVLIVDMSAATCVSTLTSVWISRYGVPAVITTDQGPQFTSSTWSALMDALSNRHVTTTPYHPRSPMGWWRGSIGN